nr:MAG TPA: hypothetical protein [Caudoviricetes sp.]
MLILTLIKQRKFKHLLLFLGVPKKLLVPIVIYIVIGTSSISSYIITVAI